MKTTNNHTHNANLKNTLFFLFFYCLILEHLYNQKRLLGDEIEVLKKSNYELFKIGVNFNQIAKANNAGDKMELPINQLYNKIQNHIKVVQDLLKSSTDIY